MADYLSIHLNNIPVDESLVNQIPSGLALYYLALPLARENGSVSVAMARPDNRAALAALGGLLGGHIVPVRGSAEEIRAAILHHHALEQAPEPRILAWSETAELQSAVSFMADLYGVALGIPVVSLDATQVDSETMLTIAREGGYALTILTPPTNITLPVLLRRSTTPMLLVRGDHCRIQRLLFASRGYASDNQVLEWMMPIWKKGQSVTWLPLLKSSLPGLAGALSINGPIRQQIEQRLQRLEQHDIPVQLRLRQGPLADQVATEVLQEAYDLLIIAAEGQGDFVAEVLQRIDACGAHSNRPIFILKPPFPIKPEQSLIQDQEEGRLMNHANEINYALPR